MTSNNKRGANTTQRKSTQRNTSSRRSSSGNKSSGKRSTATQNRTKVSNTTRKKTSVKEEEYGFDYVKTLILIGVFAVFILMFLFSLNIFDGSLGKGIESFIKGLFGINSFVIPVIGIAMLLYAIFAKHTKKMVFNMISGCAFIISVGLLDHFIVFEQMNKISYTEALSLLYKTPMGSGVLVGSLAFLIDKCFGKALILILALLLLIASVWVVFGKYIVMLFEYLFEKFQNLESGDEEDEDEAPAGKHVRRNDEVNKEEAKVKRKTPSFKIMDENPKDSDSKPEVKPEIIDVDPFEIKSIKEVEPEVIKKESNDIHQIKIADVKNDITLDEINPINVYEDTDSSKNVVHEVPVVSVSKPVENNEISVSLTDVSKAMLEKKQDAENIELSKNSENNSDSVIKSKKLSASEYVFPPINYLTSGDNQASGNKNNIKETARKLKETLSTFGVEVEIDEANCVVGPAVTRYELTPAPGVKVSRIVSLSDDIKLSLSAADIRIEAPIPGKSAVGIEVPNSVSSSVRFRDIIDSNDFRNSKSKITFAVGKDLAGQIVLADIAKMPHLLIAGATGSGKSVCINSIIMSILYKAKPEEVKMILIDPKVVELSIYNGIPHLLLPVVTDPKKASASLHWGVAEMEKRYKLFAEAEVRDIKGYNDKCKDSSSDNNMKPLPQIVIIVDELADLMMVAGKEVEESICRLAQLARAAGIHIIIATQRPSVDVITGLIKANMPSRIAFSVSSGVDSRTILDSNGAEKLLGKGDMLYFPQGMNKPSRVQGCFVSDDEVGKVVKFIKDQHIINENDDITAQLSASGNELCEVPGGEADELFAQAGSFIIDKEKASIGALQRAFKIGFNRAARIMDQLEAKGVVGPEEGTKPRKILMSVSEFEELIKSMK